jgi:hypothetical protein
MGARSSGALEPPGQDDRWGAILVTLADVSFDCLLVRYVASFQNRRCLIKILHYYECYDFGLV